MAVPLDQQFKIVKKGITEERVPLLHSSGAEQHYFVTYIPLPVNIQDGAAIEQWTERMTFIAEDLTWLLQLSHAKFWCEVAFNKDFHSMFDSYLRYAPRPQRTVISSSYAFVPNGKQLEENVSRLMFMCILRLSTHKESAENFFTPQGFGSVIYDNYIFDIPRLFDICSLYAINNKELLSKMIGNIFKQQQAYHTDLKNAIRSIADVINYRVQTFHGQTGPKKLTATTAKPAGTADIIDFLYYILDLSCTINRLFSVYPAARTIFFDEKFHLTLIELSETFLRIYERTEQSKNIEENNNLFEETKYETVVFFNDLLASCAIDPLLGNEDKTANVEAMIDIFSLLISKKRFLATYEDYFNLIEIIDIVNQTTGLLDEQQIKFYTDGVKQAIELHGTPSCKRKLLAASAPSASVTSKSTDPNVRMIHDMFPHLDDNYIQACLRHYDNNTERLVNALFDNTVPESLKGEPAVSKSADVQAKPFAREELPLLEQRANVYDNDEFDFFHRDNVDLSRIHRGKKTRDTLEILDDKSHLEGMTERYARLGLIEDETDAEYDDEYDDTYDDGIVNVRDKDDNIDKELEKNENRLTGKKPQRFRQQSDDDDDDDDEEGQMTSEKQEKIDEQLRPLYAELQKHGQTQDWDRALKTTKKILGISSNEKKATHCKIICLMQLDKFDEALTTIVKNAVDTADLTFERAYCEYRLNRIEDAYNTLKNVDRELNEREQELFAQVLFKLEKYGECVQLYRSLLKNNEDEYQSTRQANFIAALATWKLVDPSGKIQLESNDLSDETYDTTYNSACVLLSSGQYAEAESKLRKADAQCRRELEEEGDMTEEEILRETSNIRVQLAYCLQQQDKNVEALTLYNDVLKSKPTDLAVIAVASNNLAVLNRDQNLFDSRKRIKTAAAPETEPKLNAFQKKIVQVNEALLAIYTGQHDTARRILDKMVQKNDDTDDTIPLAKVSLLIKEKKLPEATQLLQDFIQNNKQNGVSLYCRLTYVQLLLSQGKVNQACDYLRGDTDLLVKPGIVATLVTLYNFLEDSKSAAEVLNEAVDRLYNLDRSKGKHSRALAYLIKQNIIYQEKQGNGQRVTEMLEILHKLYPNDTNTLSKLIVHHLKSDPERANLLAQKLPSIKQLAEGVDADMLEATFGKRVQKAEKTTEKTKATDSKATPATTAAEKKKKRRKRKIQLPKKYDPSSKPDPERWLPLRERSYYRGKRGKRGKQAAVGKGTQGAVGSDQSATTFVTTASGAQRSMPAGKTTAGASASTQPKPMPPPGKAAGKRKGKR